MIPISVERELRHAAEHWREWAGLDALAKVVTSVLNQSAFRGRNDDGNETTATWIAAENTNWTQAVDTTFRVRFEIEETAAGNSKVTRSEEAGARVLHYNLNAAGWNEVPPDGSGTVVAFVASANFTGPVQCTDQMTTSAKAFLANADMALVELGGLGSGGSATPTSQSVQAEYTLQIVGTGVANGDTLQLRMNDGINVSLDTYTNTPSITVSKGGAAATDVVDVDDFPFELIADF